MKTDRSPRPTIRRVSPRPSNPPDTRKAAWKFTSGQVVTMIVGIGSLVFSGASALFAWQQAKAANAAPIAQASAVQQVQGCGQLVRTLYAAQRAVVTTIEEYGDGARAMPNEDIVATVQTIQAAKDATEANTLFFAPRDQAVILRASEAVVNDKLMENLADDGRLQGLGPDLGGWYEELTREPVIRVGTMCRLIMYPQP